MTNKVLVFAGPSLSGQHQFRAQYSDKFIFHPPVSCGQLFEAYREGFTKFLIVDGYFDRAPAVWHKEILYVLNKGCTVVGCSSMGALRALETAPFGMVGYGRIYEDYLRGRIQDDDEVTVSHLGIKHDYFPVTDAMVNIRYTVEAAIGAGVLHSEQGGEILKHAKSTFFKKRSLKEIARTVLQQHSENFLEYLDKTGITDQKQKDAKEAIERFSKFESKPTHSEEFSHTSKLKNLQYLSNTNPPSLDFCALKEETRPVSLASFMIGKQRRLQTWLAISMMIYSSNRKTITVSSAPLPDWIQSNWVTQDKKLHDLLSSALQVCPEYLNRNPTASVKAVAMLIQFPLQALSFDDDDGSISLDSLSHYSRLIFLTALFIDALIKTDAVTEKFIPDNETLAQQKDLFKKAGIQAEDMPMDWLTHAAKIKTLLNEKNFFMRFELNEESIYWYGLSVRVCGLYTRLLTLKNENVRKKFAADFCAALAKIGTERTREFFALSGLPDDLTHPDAVEEYVYRAFSPSGSYL